MTKARQLADLGNAYDDGALSNRNLIINGAMQVAQRGTSASAPSDGSFLLDRFNIFRNGAGVVDVSQSSVAPDGFRNSLLLSVSTADTSLGSSDFGGLRYVVEGYDTAQIGFGTANAKQITLSFYARSNVVGTYSVSFRNSAANRYYTANYTIDSADTWEQKSITITADTSGTWVTDNGKGIDLRFCLWEGGFSASPDTWGDGNIIGANNTTTSWIASTNNTFYITGVQLEVGDTATPFEHRSYGDELLACKRYFQRIAGGESGITGSAIMTGIMHNSTFLEGIYKMEVEMRTEPTLERVAGTDYYGFSRNGAQDTFNSISIDAGIGNPRQVNLYNATEVSGTAGQGGIMFSKVEAAIVSLSAEL